MEELGWRDHAITKAGTTWFMDGILLSAATAPWMREIFSISRSALSPASVRWRTRADQKG